MRPRLGHWLVIAQLAGSLVLLVTALLMTRTLLNLRDAPLGFRPAQLLAFDLSFPKVYPDTAKAALYQRLHDRLTAAAGVTGVTYSGESIYSEGGWSGEAWLPDAASTTRSHAVALLRVGPRFFDVVGITRAGGRVFGEDDHRADRQVVIINETFARQFFGTTPPIGRRLVFDAGGKKALTIVGVVKDVRHYGAREQPCDGRVAYLPESLDTPSGAFYVRGLTSVADVQRIVREELRDAGGAVLLERLRPIDIDVADMVARERLVGYLASGFALLALMVAAIGLFGVLAYGVAQRTAEIGLRAALGATPTSLMHLILRDALRLVAAGLLLGLPIAIAGARILGSLLFEVTPTDVIAFSIAPLLLAIVAAIAAWLPARRAATIDPLIALRRS